MINTDMPNKVHEGRNVKHFREMPGIKQEALAYEPGKDWTQNKVSLPEQKEIIEPEVLEQVIISSTLHDNAGSINNNCTLTFNPIDKCTDFKLHH